MKTSRDSFFVWKKKVERPVQEVAKAVTSDGRTSIESKEAQLHRFQLLHPRVPCNDSTPSLRVKCVHRFEKKTERSDGRRKKTCCRYYYTDSKK